MANNITTDFHHSETKRIAYFLNNIEDTLQEVPLDWSHWKMPEAIVAGWRYTSTNAQHPLTVTVLLCTSYQAAQQMTSLNSHIRWGQNGNITFSAESDDQRKADTVMGLFAGEE
jgi:hypothetical protein